MASAAAIRVELDFADRASGPFQQSMSNMELSVMKMTQSMIQLRNIFYAVQAIPFAIQTIAAPFEKINQYAEDFVNLSARLKNVTTSTYEYTQVQGQLLELADETRGSLKETTAFYVKAAATVKDYGIVSQDLISAIKIVNQSLLLSGATTREAAAGTTQLTQAFASGRLAGDEFRSVMENMPGVALALANGLGVSIGQLREMSRAGELTTEMMIKGLLASSQQVEEQFRNMPLTISQAYQLLENHLLMYIGESEKVQASTSLVADVIKNLALNLDVAAKAFKMVVIAATPATISLLWQTFGNNLIKFLTVLPMHFKAWVAGLMSVSATQATLQASTTAFLTGYTANIQKTIGITKALGSALNFLNTPLGAIISILTGFGVMAWMEWGNKAQEEIDETQELINKTRDLLKIPMPENEGLAGHLELLKAKAIDLKNQIIAAKKAAESETEIDLGELPLVSFVNPAKEQEDQLEKIKKAISQTQEALSGTAIKTKEDFVKLFGLIDSRSEKASQNLQQLTDPLRSEIMKIYKEYEKEDKELIAQEKRLKATTDNTLISETEKEKALSLIEKTRADLISARELKIKEVVDKTTKTEKDGAKEKLDAEQWYQDNLARLNIERLQLTEKTADSEIAIARAKVDQEIIEFRRSAKEKGISESEIQAWITEKEEVFQKEKNEISQKYTDKAIEEQEKSLDEYDKLYKSLSSSIEKEEKETLEGHLKANETWYADTKKKIFQMMALEGWHADQTLELLDELNRVKGIKDAEAYKEEEKRIKDAALEAAKAWDHAYESMQDALAEWIEKGTISFNSLLNSFKKMLADMESAWIINTLRMRMPVSLGGYAGIPGMGMTGGSSTGDLFSLSGLMGGFSDFYSMPATILQKIGSELGSFDLFQAGVHLEGMPGLSAGLMSAFTTALLTGDAGKSLGAGVGSYLGYTIGSSLGSFGGPIGAVMGQIAGGILGGLFGGGEPDDVDLHVLFGDPNKARTDFDTFAGEWHEEFLAGDRSIGEAIAVNIRKGDYMSDADAIKAEEAIVDYFNGIFSAIETQFGVSVVDAIEGQGLGIHYNDFQNMMEEGDIQGALNNLTEQFFQAFTDELATAILGADMGGLITFEKLQGWQIEGENIADTFIRIVSALESIPDIIQTIDTAIGLMDGSVSESEASIDAFKASLEAMDNQIAALQAQLLYITDPSQYIALNQELSGLIIQRYDLEKNKIAEIEQAIVDLRIEELNWLLALQQQLDSWTGEVTTSDMLLDMTLEMQQLYFDADNAADKMKYLNQTLEYYAQYVDSVIASITASYQAQIDAIQAQSEQITESYQAQIDAINEEYNALIEIAQQWEQVADNVQRLLDELIYTSESPADVFERMERMQQEMAGLDLSKPEDALRYTELAGEYAQLLGEAYGDTSNPEYIALYNEMVENLDALGVMAGAQKSSEELQAELNAEVEALQASMDAELQAIDDQVAALNAQMQAEIDAFLAIVEENYEWAKNEGMALYDQMLKEQTDALSAIIGDKEAEEYMADLQFATVNELVMIRSNLENITTLLGGTPTYGEGGYVDKKHLAWVGDEPEYIIPQNRLEDFYKNRFPQYFVPGDQPSGGKYHTMSMNVSMPVTITSSGKVDENKMAKALEAHIERSMKPGGRLNRVMQDSMRYN